MRAAPARIQAVLREAGEQPPRGFAAARYPARAGDVRGPDEVAAVDQHGQVIDVLVPVRRDAAAASRFFTWVPAYADGDTSEVITDAAPIDPGVPDAVLPAA